MNDAVPPPPARRSLRWIVPLTALVVVGAGGAWGWTQWQAQQARAAQR